MNCRTTSTKSNILSYPTLISIYIFTALNLSAPASLAQQSPAAGSSTSASTELRRYNIPAQLLSEALIEFGKQSGLQVTTGSVLVEGKQAPSVSGTLSAEQALNQLLAGNDLRYEVNGGMVRLAAGTETTALPSVRIGAQSLGMTDLPPAYAGGQVARGGRIGLLGNRDIFDTPFSVTSYTAELIENQQARTVADVIRNDSSAYLTNPRHGYAETIVIRGFTTGGSGVGLYDGLPSLLSESVRSVRTLERVEIFKGPNALLNGTGGTRSNVGGTINMVPKRPTEPPLTRLTTDYDYKSRFGIHADLSRRFGSKKQFGARLNAIYHKGESAIEDNEEEWGQMALAVQYRTDKIRLETILDYSNQNLDRGNTGFILGREATSVPSPPDLEDAIQQPWEKREPKFTRALLRAEYSPDKTWTMHAAYGAIDFETYGIWTWGLPLNANGNFDITFAQQLMMTEKKYVWNAGIRGQFKTGQITHQIAVETVQSETKASFASRAIPNVDFASNLYQPRFIARPQFDRITRNPTKTGDNVYSSIAIADTMGFFDERVLLTVGIRRQTINTQNFNPSTGMRTRKYDKSSNTPAIGLVVKPWSFMSIYGNYIEALEQGPTAPRTAANAGEVFPPNETEQIEFGMKFNLDGLGLTTGVFQIERPSAITDENRRFGVDGEQRNRGLELNAFGELRPDLRLLGGITYIDSELTRTQGGRFDGNDATGVPELAAVLNLEWDASFLSGLTLTARAEHRDSQYIRLDNSLKIPSYELYAIGARYRQSIGDQQFTFRMNIDNLLNKDYWNTFAASHNNNLYLGSPRRVNLSMSMDF